MSTPHSLVKSFGFAFQGIKEGLVGGRNFRIQFVLAFFSILLGFALKVSEVEWLVLIIAIALVLILELINTSVESIVDIVSPQIQEKAKIAKDTAAAAVLVSSIASLLIGGIIFLPKFFQ